MLGMAPHPIFTDREVTYIRRTPLRAATLAEQYGVDEQVIIDIRSGDR